MYDSLTNGETFRKPKFDYKSYVTQALVKPMKAPNNAFMPGQKGRSNNNGSWESDEEESKEDEEEIPSIFKSRREERLYLGRGYNRMSKIVSTRS